jgi:hypothetical protein
VAYVVAAVGHYGDGRLARDADGLQERLLAHPMSSSEAQSARMRVAPTGAARDKLRGDDRDPALAVFLRAGCLDVPRIDLEGQGRPGRRKAIGAPKREAASPVACLASRSSRCPIVPTFLLMLEAGKSLPPGNASRKKILASR